VHVATGGPLRGRFTSLAVYHSPKGQTPSSFPTHIALYHVGLPLKCHTLDHTSVGVFGTEMKLDLPGYSLGMEVVRHI
jgi:hypothetical protein